MSTTYKAVNGDTFESVARKVYGLPQEAARVQTANPGVQEPIAAGTVLVITDIPGAPRDKTQNGPANSVNECALKINGQRFRFWDTARLIRAIDTLDSMEFTAPFDPNDARQRAAFKPFTYPQVEFEVNGGRVFNGVSLGPLPSVDSESKSIQIGGYARAGVLSDCNIPVSAFPLEFNNAGLGQIAEKIAGFFGIGVTFTADAGATFDRVACLYDQRALDFLADLAKQRGLVIGNDVNGDLVFRTADTGTATVTQLEEGRAPLSSVSVFFDHQQYYSHVTGIEPVVVGATGSKYTVTNARLAGIIRPYTFKVADAVGGDVQPAAEAKMGRMFANMASYSVNVTTWRDAAGRLWEPGATVSLFAPSAMVYTPYSFVIRSAVFERDAGSERATLDLILPGSFAGKIPEALPWD